MNKYSATTDRNFRGPVLPAGRASATNTELSSACQGNGLINTVADWPMNQAVRTTDFEDLLRLIATPMHLWQSTIAFQTLHPMYEAIALTSCRESGLEPIKRFPAGTGSATVADVQKRLVALNERRGGEDRDFGIGLHVYDVMYDNIGVQERIEMSAVEPAANESACIEFFTKETGCRIFFYWSFRPPVGPAVVLPCEL